MAKRQSATRKRVVSRLAGAWHAVRVRQNAFLKRRPHRSLRRTRRRDYVRSFNIQGYWAFTAHVVRTLAKRRRLWGSMIFLYATLLVVFGGITSQETYRQLGSLLTETTGELFAGNFGSVAEAGLLSVAAFAGNGGAASEVQQMLVSLVGLLIWLCTVWLLREHLAGQKPRLRDGLYSSAAPLVATMIIALVFVVQQLPIGVMGLAYSGLAQAGLLTDGFGSFMVFIVALLTITLTLYWATATIVAAVVITLPGMYPLRALRIAGDMVVGRRLRILFRILWMVLLIALAWLLIMVPVVLLDAWLIGVWQWASAIPLVPLVAAFATATSIIFAAAYVYILYRKLVEDDAKPA